MPSYLYLRLYNHLSANQTGADVLIHGKHKPTDLLKDRFRENSIKETGGHTLLQFRAKNSGQEVEPDERTDLGAQFEADEVRVRSLSSLSAAAATDLYFSQTVGVDLKPVQPPPARASVSVDWRFRNDEADTLVYHDLYFMLFERAGPPDDELRKLVRRVMRNQPDPLNLPLSLAVLGTSGTVSFDQESGSVTLAAGSAVRFRAVFMMEKPAWHAYPVVTARAGRPATPPERLVEFAQMCG